MRWTGTHHGVYEQGIHALQLVTDRGVVDCRYHPASVAGSKLGAVWVGGAGGGLEGPARGLYLEACRCLQELGVAGLRLHYRHPNDLPACVLDALLGVEFLATQGIERVALVGHSFGGAVVISAGAICDRVRAIVALSTQTQGTDQAAALSPRALLLVHGSADEVLPAACSRLVYARAGEPKELVLYPGAMHGLDTAREELLALLVSWIPEALRREAGAPRVM